VGNIKFNEYYNKYSKKLFNYALWLTRNKAASEDILQNVFIKIWKYETILYEGKGIETWLYKVTRNACLDFFRKSSRLNTLRQSCCQEEHRYSENLNELENIWNVLEDLKEKEKSILYLHFHQGNSFKEVAAILEIEESDVRVTSFRALKKLRARYKKESV